MTRNISYIDTARRVIATEAAALDLLEAAPKRKIGAAIFLAGMRVASLGEARMEKAMETEAAERIGRLESGFSLLVALGSIAPITGFLGTVSGMIGAFQSIANAADVNAQLVAGGIFEALITTAFGLAIAIVAITGYNIFAHVVDRFAAQVEVAGVEYDVGIGEVFATNFKIVSIDADSVVMLFGDNAFELQIGQQIIK